MDHQSENIRTKETSVLLQRVDGSLAQWRQFDFSNVLAGRDLGQIMSNLDRARRQFDSKLFFVVIFGPLKAGKSTLTNSLANEYVSPAGFGKETTRRPSLVIRAEDSGIDQYFSTDPEVNHFLSQRRLQKYAGNATTQENDRQILGKVHEYFNTVADYLRGIRSKEEFPQNIHVKTFPLNPLNLEQTLTQDLTWEPLLTVIRCQGGHLLNDGVAVIDMPGLDGSRSNWREDPIHGWVISRAEFFLFVQSSVAALNNETHNFLKEIVAQSTKPPIWLVQNIFDARHWQPVERRQQFADEQREEGKKRVFELLNEAPRAVLGLNAGLAWDAKNEGRAEWLEESEFPQFEAGLSAVLHAERATIQERNCLEYMSQRLAEGRVQLDQIVQRVAELRSHHNEMRGTLRAAQEHLATVNYRSDWESDVRGEIATLAEMTMKPWRDGLKNEVDKLRARHDRERLGKEVNEGLQSAAVKMGAEGDSTYFAKSPLLPPYVNLANKFCKSAEGEAVVRCNQLLNELGKPALPTALAPSIEDLPAVLIEAFTADQLKEKRSWFGLGGKTWIDKQYNGAHISGHIDRVASAWTQQLEERKDAWKNQLVSNHFSIYCEKRRQHLCSHLQRLLAEFESQAKPKEEAATATENLLRQMNEALGNLELPLANASLSMK